LITVKQQPFGTTAIVYYRFNG